MKEKKPILILLTVVVVYFLIRLPNLTLQPIFVDEAIYIRWAQVMNADATLRFIPLTDGKTPLFMWFLMPVLKFVSDPLLAGRLLSIFSGFLTLLGVYFLGRKVFNFRAGIWATMLCALVPYTVFFDRMALVDSMMAAFSIWSLYFAIWLVQKNRLDLAMVLGFLLGGGILVKTPAVLNLVCLPFTLLCFKFKAVKRITFFKLIILIALAFFMAEAIYNLLRLSPNFPMLSSRDADYKFPISRLFTNPFDPFIPHFKDFTEWIHKLLTIPVLITVVTGAFLAFKKRNKEAMVILIWSILPTIILVSFLKQFTARYLLFTIPPLLVLAGYGIDEIVQRINKSKFPKTIGVALMLILVSFQSLNFDYLLLTHPEKTSLPKNDRRGYFEDWTAGYGFPEIAQFLISRKKEVGKVVVGTEGSFGTLPDGLQIYLDKSEIPIIGGGVSVSDDVRTAAIENETYFIGNKSRLPNGIPNAKLIKEYLKAIPWGDFSRDSILVYQVYPDPDKLKKSKSVAP